MQIPKIPAIDSGTRRNAFTLIELLTVIAIIGILASIVIATVGQVRKKANQVKCLSNLRQVGMAILAYTVDNKDQLPYNSQVSATAKYTSTGKKSLGYNLASYLSLTRPEDLTGDGTVQYLLCPQRIADNPTNSFPTHFIVQAIVPTDTAKKYSNGTTRPFGTDSVPPIRYNELADFGGPSRVWALLEADQQVKGTGYAAISGSGWFSDLSETPAHGRSRVVLFFDGHTQLMNTLPPRPM